MGIALPEYGWTWDDFFAMADEVERYNAENGTEWLLLSDNSFSIPSLFQQYGCENNDIWNGAANYTDEYFIELADKWLSAYQRGLVGECDDWNFETVENALFTSYVYISPSVLNIKSWVMPPMLKDGYACPFDAPTMQLYSGSAHPEMAAYFIACYMSEEAIVADSIYFSSILIKDVDKYASEDVFIPEEDQISDENIALWLNAVRDGASLIYYSDIYRDQWNEFYPALIAGEMTPEEFAFACQQKADMVLGE